MGLWGTLFKAYISKQSFDYNALNKMTYIISPDGSEQSSGCSDDPTIQAILNSQKINQNRVLEISFDGVSKARLQSSHR